jgi:hypothetical protein
VLAGAVAEHDREARRDRVREDHAGAGEERQGIEIGLRPDANEGLLTLRHQLPEIQAVLKDADDNIVNLTGALGVRFIMTNKATGTNKVDAAATVVTPAAGLVKYTWEEEDTDEAATFKGEFEVQFADGRLETFPNDSYIDIKVQADLGGVR